MQLKERTISVCKTVSISVPRHSVCYSRQHYNMVKFTMNCSIPIPFPLFAVGQNLHLSEDFWHAVGRAAPCDKLEK